MPCLNDGYVDESAELWLGSLQILDHEMRRVEVPYISLVHSDKRLVKLFSQAVKEVCSHQQREMKQGPYSRRCHRTDSMQSNLSYDPPVSKAVHNETPLFARHWQTPP